jgi:hypothetical protein
MDGACQRGPDPNANKLVSRRREIKGAAAEIRRYASAWVRNNSGTSAGGRRPKPHSAAMPNSIRYFAA